MEDLANAALAREASDLSDADAELPPNYTQEDRSSSPLSEIQQDEEQEEDASDDVSNPSDSEAETTRLEDSPNRPRIQQNIIHSERSPSKLNNQMLPGHMDDIEDQDGVSEDDLPILSPSRATSFRQESRRSLSSTEVDSRKRKRSIMAGSGLDEDFDEPEPKRTGSIITGGDDYAIEDDDDDDDEPEEPEPQPEEEDEEEADTSNPISGNISGDEGADIDEDGPGEDIEDRVAPEEPAGVVESPASPKKAGRKKRKATNGVHAEDGPDSQDNGPTVNGDEVRNGDGEEGDEADAALKSEEELEKKKGAFDQLSRLEKQFSLLRERLFDERLRKLNEEEASLKEDKPSHPTLLTQLECIEARRTERVRIADRILELEIETTNRSAVAKRSQIMTQYRQDVREIREQKLEQLGKQWYEIQHDRRSYAGSVPDYALRFPTKKSQQVENEIAYANEVSVLSGFAKHVGFPAAPQMAPATASELEEDLERMGRKRHVQHAGPHMHGMSAMRTAGSTSSRFRPAEDQFLQQNAWANPQHASHAHYVQRQNSAQHTPRTSSPVSQIPHGPPSRRHSHQPNAGHFSQNASSQHHTHVQMSTSANAHTIGPSPLNSRQPSLSPLQNRAPVATEQQNHHHHHYHDNHNGSVFDSV